jgi:hypothetical protein
MTGPDFMVVGTQKAGTTWLFECLNEHPGVFVPELKEVHYFCPPGRCRVSRAAKGEAWYRGLYADAPPGSVRGDMTTDYMYLPGVAAALQAFNPGLKIIFLLRDPVERAYSQYWMRRRQTPGMEDFATHLAGNRNLIERGLYHRQIAKYFEFFPREQCRIWIYEEMVKDPAAFFADLCRFLGVNDAFRPKSLLQRVGETKVLDPRLGSLFYRVGSPIINLPVILPIWRFLRRNTRIKEILFATQPGAVNGTGSSYQPLSRQERNEVEPIFADENRQLYVLLGRDIAAWQH